MEWARWMWTAVTSSGDSSLLVLQGGPGRRQVSSVRFVSVSPDAGSAGGRGSPRAHQAGPSSWSPLMLGSGTFLCSSYW